MPEYDASQLDNPLSEREMEVARLLATGASNAEIARDLVISPHTVKVHLRNIFEKLQVNSRTEASMVLVQRGWIVVPGAVVETGADVETAPPLPEPEPLYTSAAHLPFWPRMYVAGALALCVFLLLAPYAGALMPAAADLLTNADEPRSAPPAAQLEPRWQVRTPLPQPLGRHALVNLAGRIVRLGGETVDGAALDSVQFFDEQSGRWVALTPLPTPLANLAVTPLGNVLYVAGGSHPTTDTSAPLLTDQLLRYDADLNTWTVVNKLPYAVAGAGLVADDVALYLIGGWDGQNVRDEIWRYAPGTQAGWELVGHLTKGRAFLGAAAVRGDIYIAGGYDGAREVELLERFSPATGENRVMAPMATPRGGLALVYDGVALYAIGGGWTQPVSNLERYDLSTNAWSNFPSPIQGEWRNLAAAGRNGLIYITGGWAGDYLDIHLEFQSSFRALLPVISND